MERETEQSENRKIRVREVIDQYRDGDNLQEMSFDANLCGLPTSRQTIHNWYTGKHMPSKTLLDLYIRILTERTGPLAERLLQMYQDLYRAAGYEK